MLGNSDHRSWPLNAIGACEECARLFMAGASGEANGILVRLQGICMDELVNMRPTLRSATMRMVKQASVSVRQEDWVGMADQLRYDLLPELEKEKASP